MGWERSYVQAAIERLRPAGDVLEVGFSEASLEIAKFHPRSHTLLESDPLLFQEAKKRLSKNSQVVLLQENWRQALDRLGVFDAIYWGKKSLAFAVSKLSASKVLEEGKRALQEAYTLLPDLQKMRYTEKEIALFCEGLKNSKEALSRFIFELEHAGQISSEIREKIVKKYHLKEVKFSKEPKIDSSEMVEFFTRCLALHMRKGSRFSACLELPTSKFEDPLFYEAVITNPLVDFKEFLIPMAKTKEHPFEEALIISVEKLL